MKWSINRDKIIVSNKLLAIFYRLYYYIAVVFGILLFKSCKLCLGGNMQENIRQQKMIASILLDIGLEDELIEIITSLTKEEIQEINKKDSY